MNFHEFEQQHRFRRAWEAVEIARPVSYSLFTFGDSDLPYFLVCAGKPASPAVSIRRGPHHATAHHHSRQFSSRIPQLF
jgi:hypothetical protein